MVNFDTSVIESIGNFGIMIVICSIVTVFLIKVLNHMLDQSRKVNDLAFKEVGKVISLITEKMRDLTNLISNNYNSIVTKLNSLIKDSENLLEEEERTQRLLENLTQEHRAYLMQMVTVTEIQRNLLKDIKHHCPAVYSREIILQELVKRGYVTREQIKEVLDYLEEDKK